MFLPGFVPETSLRIKRKGSMCMSVRYAKKNDRRMRSLITIAVFVLLIVVLLICQLCLKGGGDDFPEDFGEEPVVSEEDSSWQLVLVNRDHPFSPQTGFSPVVFENGQKVDSRIVPALKKMFEACRRDGLLPCVTSAYRSPEQQRQILDAKVEEMLAAGVSEKDAVTEALGWAAEPGHSEHETGLALDINSSNEKKCPSRRVYAWFAEHGAEYGFILRYPEEKTAVTGVEYEPWHFRYVGRKAAEEIRSSGVCLEEYLSGR